MALKIVWGDAIDRSPKYFAMILATPHSIPGMDGSTRIRARHPLLGFFTHAAYIIHNDDYVEAGICRTYF